MSAILSEADLNDFISPGVACIKPVETLPVQSDHKPYEVTTEDKLLAANPTPAAISLTDCLACSGCVTSAEAVLISLQSHSEVLSTLDDHPSIDLVTAVPSGQILPDEGRIFVASVSPQVRASLAATYNISEKQAGYMIDQLLSGNQGLKTGGNHGSSFAYVVDTNRMREACLVLGADEIANSPANTCRSRPILTSACPGWICYAEKTHPHVLPHLSKLKSPQALTGTLLKSILSKSFNGHPSQIWHLAIMPCFDKKLEASRSELTDHTWHTSSSTSTDPVRDVDCVITTRELLTLASARNISLRNLPLRPLPRSSQPAFPHKSLAAFLFPPPHRRPLPPLPPKTLSSGTSGGYLHHVLAHFQSLHPGSAITTARGRNADVIEYILIDPLSPNTPILKAARYYGFRNIQNLVRKLKPPRVSKLPGSANRRKLASDAAGVVSDLGYVEVMACPGGCTNGGGQVRVEDVQGLGLGAEQQLLGHKEWKERVDEAYFSADSSCSASDGEEIQEAAAADGMDTDFDEAEVVDGIHVPSVRRMLSDWAEAVDVPIEMLVYTTYRKVESDVGKKSGIGDTERIAAIAGASGGGW